MEGRGGSAPIAISWIRHLVAGSWTTIASHLGTAVFHPLQIFLLERSDTELEDINCSCKGIQWQFRTCGKRHKHGWGCSLTRLSESSIRVRKKDALLGRAFSSRCICSLVFEPFSVLCFFPSNAFMASARSLHFSVLCFWDGNVYDEMSALGPLFYVGAQIWAFAGSAFLGSTVLLKYGISCDSARWCQFIPSVIKKKLNAASSRSASSCFLLFALCLCPVVSSLLLRSVAYWKLPGVRKLLSWGFEVWSFCGLFECKLSTASCTCSFCTCCDHVKFIFSPYSFCCSV